MHEMVDQFGSVERPRGEAEALGADGDGGGVDGLDVDGVVGQEAVGHLLAEMSVADDQGDDVGVSGEKGQPRLEDPGLEQGGVLLLERALQRGLAEMTDGGQGARGEDRGQGGGEDEARGQGADEVDDVGGAGDVAAKDAEGLAEGAGDHVDAVGNAVALGDAAALAAVEADGVDLVEEGEGVVALGEGDDVGDGGDGTIHGVDALEDDDLGAVEGEGAEELLEVGGVVVPEDELVGAAVSDALDQRGVVLGVGEERHLGKDLGQRLQRGGVGHVARAEQQRRLLAVQRRQLLLQQHVEPVGPRDVARAPGPRPCRLQRLVHRLEHLGVLSHPQVVVAAPHRHRRRRLLVHPPVHEPVARRLREPPLCPLDVGELAVPPVCLEPLDVVLKLCSVKLLARLVGDVVGLGCGRVVGHDGDGLFGLVS